MTDPDIDGGSSRIRATVIRVMSPGGDGLPWHGVVCDGARQELFYARLDEPWVSP